MELKVHDQEILLQKLWKSQKLSSESLRALSGENIEIIYEGSENLDTGPDFKDAVIKVEGQILKGDIEVHLDPSGWYAHGHHQDPRYNGVILHLVSKTHETNAFIEREDGVQVRQILVNTDRAKAELWKAPHSAPKISDLIVEDCPLSQREETKITRTIQAAGEQRLHDKADQLREDRAHSSWDQLIYAKVLEALGYSKNQVPFKKLAELLPYATLRAEMQWVADDVARKKAAALLFGSAGLLPFQSKKDGEILDSETLDYIGPLEYLWNQMSHRLEAGSMKHQAWQFFRLRPQNFPTRRLAGMAQLLSRFNTEGLVTGFLKIFSGNESDYIKICKELETRLLVQAEGFWSNHYRFEAAAEKSSEAKPPALIGKDRARDVVVNIILPVLFLYSSETDDSKLRNAVREVFVRYPKLSENSITKAMLTQLFANKTRSSHLIKSASQQQGMILLHKTFCRPLKCTECLSLSD